MNHKNFIKLAIELANDNVKKGGGPFGALIVQKDKIIAKGVNQVVELNDPTAHAEVQAIRNACKKIDSFKLKDCVIYSSCEPCPMCFSSIYWAHIEKVYFAANKTDAANSGFDDDFIYREISLGHTERKIPFQEIKHELKLMPFNSWDELDDKINY